MTTTALELIRRAKGEASPSALVDQRLEARALSQLANLGVVALDEAVTVLDTEPLRPEDFTVRALALLYQRLADTIRSHGSPTLDVLHSRLTNEALYEQAGGGRWLAQVLSASDDVRSGSYRGSVLVLRELTKRRAVEDAARRLSEAAHAGGDDLDRAIADAQGELSRSSVPGMRIQTLEPSIREWLDERHAAQHGMTSLCIPTGIKVFDEVVGGLFADVLHFIGSSPG